MHSENGATLFSLRNNAFMPEAPISSTLNLKLNLKENLLQKVLRRTQDLRRLARPRKKRALVLPQRLGSRQSVNIVDIAVV